MCIGPPLVLSMHLCFPFICRSVGLFMALASVLALMEKGKFVGSGDFCRAVFYTCQPSFKRVTTALAWAFLCIFDLFPCLHWPTFVFLSFLTCMSLPFTGLPCRRTNLIGCLRNFNSGF